MQVLATLENLPAVPEGEVRPDARIEQQMEVDEVSREDQVQGDRTATKISKGIVTGKSNYILFCE